MIKPRVTNVVRLKPAPSTPADFALAYLKRGWQPLRLPPREKAIRTKGWEKQRVVAGDVARVFKAPCNVGVILGKPSGHLVDVDLDCPEALALAGSLLPDTDSVFGRLGKPRSHRLYICPGAKLTQFLDPETKTMLVELRSTGGQTVFPGSVHRETGQAIEWADNGDPADVDTGRLTAAVRSLAAASLLTRAAPDEGRHDYLLVIAGVLVRGLGRDEAGSIHHAIARATLGDLYSRAEGDRLLDDTESKIEAGEHIPGIPRLVEEIGDKRARKVIEWLEIKPSGVERPAWYNKLIRGRHEPYDNIANVVTALTSDPAFAGQVAFDQMIGAVVAKELPWQAGTTWRRWEDVDTIALAHWCQERGLNARGGTCDSAVQLFAGGNPIHPLREHLSALRWDRKKRLSRLLIHYLGAEDNTYNREVGRRWTISAVARAFMPGCKADHMLILEATQGFKQKSTFCAVLALRPEWFTDDIRDIGTKDSAQDLIGKWIVEIAELSAMRRADVERLKAFFSRSTDHYRPSYGRRSQDFPRGCVFIGTTNSDAYLTDETGARRFWPVRVGAIRLAELKRDMDQIWAEAVVAYRDGEPWHLTPEVEALARDEQDKRRQIDAWEDEVLKYAEGKGAVEVGDILRRGLLIDLSKQDQRASLRVARILRAHGWERRQRRVGSQRVWIYYPPKA